eukprot:5497249-Pyramimonas_sp.AAC.1
MLSLSTRAHQLHPGKFTAKRRTPNPQARTSRTLIISHSPRAREAGSPAAFLEEPRWGASGNSIGRHRKTKHTATGNFILAAQSRGSCEPST